MSVAEETLEQLRSSVAERRRVGMETVEAVPLPRPVPVPAAWSTPPVLAPRAVAAPAPVSAAIPVAAPHVALPAGDKPARWAALRELVLNDPVCLKHVPAGKKIVVGSGSLDAKIFFCGDAPGEEEEVQGEPFVGPAGQLLTRMIQGMGLKREEVYLGYTMNWRPQIPAGLAGVQVGNRHPTEQEMNYCLPFLRAQIEVVQPELIVALGGTAAGGLLGAHTFKSLGEVKGRWHEFAGRPVMVTYHPSYILQSSSNRSKRGIWEDLLKVMERTGLPVSEKQRNFFL